MSPALSCLGGMMDSGAPVTMRCDNHPTNFLNFKMVVLACGRDGLK